ncbi:MAG: GSCFA domain-containing protein [Lacibacter sp.]|jgi:hypothetical protein
MKWMTDIEIKPLPMPIEHTHRVMMVGSCFTEHIGKELNNLKFNILENPNGILFDTKSVCRSLVSYVYNRQYGREDLFYLNELYHSWEHHSRFSHPDAEVCLQQINESQQRASHYVKQADWLIITLGSSFSYRLLDPRRDVANCHKAPQQWFEKHLVSIEEQIALLDNTIHQLFHANNRLKIIFTISPVRHLRDGVVNNNRSKARLLETVHHLVEKFDRIFYFPAYELVIDVLRDYRFYDIDLAHPNYAATQFVMEKFSEFAFSESTRQLNAELRQLQLARNHRPFHPASQQHQKFLAAHLAKARELALKHPYLNLADWIAYFSSQLSHN